MLLVGDWAGPSVDGFVGATSVARFFVDQPPLGD